MILITYLAFAMLRFANVEEKYTKKLQAAAKNVSRAAADDDDDRVVLLLLLLPACCCLGRCS